MIITEVVTDGLMSQLGEEIIESYDTGESGKAISDIIDDLLAFQRKSTTITKGTISASGTRAVNITNRSILAILLQLQESIGGYIYVDNDRKLQWATSIGEDKGQQIRYRKNLIGIERDIDYGGYCTKLHPVGGTEQLSDIAIGPVDVDTDTDASYGYIILKETYAAYQGFTEVGDTLPDNMTVYKQNASPQWKVASGVDSAPGWGIYGHGTALCIDDDWDTYGNSNAAAKETWSAYITCSIESGHYGTCHFKVDYDYSGIDTYSKKVQVDIYDGANWTNIYDGSLGSKQFNFSGQNVQKFRVRFFSGYGSYSGTFWLELYECQFLQSSITDDSSKWAQGALENTIRCAIGDYDAGATYQIAYTYANYLMAWDKISDADDIVAKVITNKYEQYAISLLEGAILLLDELKEIPITYRVNTVDLSKNEDFNFSFEELQLGSTITVIDEDLSIDVSVRVISIIHPDLLNPENIELQLSNRVKDISDYLADIYKKVG